MGWEQNENTEPHLVFKIFQLKQSHTVALSWQYMQRMASNKA